MTYLEYIGLFILIITPATYTASLLRILHTEFNNTTYFIMLIVFCWIVWPVMLPMAYVQVKNMYENRRNEYLAQIASALEKGD